MLRKHFVWFFVALFSINSAWAEDITESQVLSLLDKLDLAVVNRDVPGVLSTMSDDVVIKLTMKMQGSEQKLQLNKAQYQQMLRQAWEVYEDYQYQRVNQRIELQGDKAIISADVHESMTIQGQALATVTREKSTVAKQGGQLLILNVSGTAEL